MVARSTSPGTGSVSTSRTCARQRPWPRFIALRTTLPTPSAPTTTRVSYRRSPVHTPWPSIATTFAVTAGMFGALALYGTTTNRSLAGVGQFMFMGLIGLILASLVGVFVKSDGLQFVISVVGVLVFTGLTAYDAQRLKAMAVAVPEGRVGSYAVVGALALYLDFINLFLFLLRFLGGRRD